MNNILVLLLFEINRYLHVLCYKMYNYNKEYQYNYINKSYKFINK